ncbi:MAG: ribose-phosphate pyrophosphokinase [Lachnospiraceae bacterium]|nr:ribose-phosphate pyrophosphokinase [Lachnospiraceae bacterium]
MSVSEKTEKVLPVAPLKITYIEGSRPIAKQINSSLVKMRRAIGEHDKEALTRQGYIENNYLLDAHLSRYGTGEGKATLNESVRGTDLYIVADVMNYSVTYKLCGRVNHMSPDNHFQDLKRIISAANGKAHRISVIMPFLYESRQHKRSGRESLDAAMALRELQSYGVSEIITFDAHDPRVRNAIPLRGFDNFMPTYQFLRALLKAAPDLNFDSDHFMVISPDEGAMNRAVYFSNILGADIGMFYKRRDYSKIVNGKNPIVAHEFLGASVEGKDCVVIDDMISSGGSMLDVCKQMKERGAKRVFICTTFGLFTDGFAKFDEYYEKGLFTKLITTNLCYRPQELLDKPYYETANMYKYIASIINTLNHDQSADKVRSTTSKITKMLFRVEAERNALLGDSEEIEKK